MAVIIRKEVEADWEAVEKLTRDAFWREERIEKIGIGANEHFMVHLLRGNEGIDDLTFVAELDGEIVGHVIYAMSCYVIDDDGSKKNVLTFGPLSVKPSHQKQGIGSMLMEHSIRRAKELGYGGIIIYGHPTYYPRFGFKEAKEFGITTDKGENFPAFMAMALEEGYFDDINGRFILSDVYDDNKMKEEAIAFDQKFQ